jgi:hypothetical protein
MYTLYACERFPCTDGGYRLEGVTVVVCIVCDVTSENKCILTYAGTSDGL